MFFVKSQLESQQDYVYRQPYTDHKVVKLRFLKNMYQAVYIATCSHISLTCL